MAKDELLEAALETLSGRLVQVACDEAGLSKIVLARVGLTQQRFEYLSEHDDNNPQYQLYYAELSNLTMKAMGRAIDKMTN